jgi:ATP-dependent Clp protease adaptor protein ClpS
MGIESENNTEPKKRMAPMYNVVVLNDEYHTYDYVVEMLMYIFKFDLEKATDHTIEIDSTGRSIVYTGPLEHSEMKQEQINNCGSDPSVVDCHGPMAVRLELID